nr:HGGxSTG domain-containing protein [Polynucleobacter sp. 31A-FELB]
MTRNGTPCKNAPLIGGAGQKCKFHGGMSLMGARHPNWRHGKCTKEARLRSKATTAELRFLRMLVIQLGMIES